MNMPAFQITAPEMDEPLARAATVTEAIDALLVEGYYAVAYASREHALCDHDAGVCTVETDAAGVEGLDRRELEAYLTDHGIVSLYLESYEWGFSASLTAERIDANAEAGQ
jgi:hypothetical protein